MVHSVVSQLYHVINNLHGDGSLSQLYHVINNLHGDGSLSKLYHVKGCLAQAQLL